jgi:hypothetical protein
MMKTLLPASRVAALMAVLVFSGCQSPAREVTRPERIRSMREVIYDQETYQKLATQWKAYYDAYPSEDAYANWMYATRYAQDENYSRLLDKGLKKYPANPILLYLKGLQKCGLDDAQSRANLERAVALAPDYVDPWFALATNYMAGGDEERLDIALRRLLESGIIRDDVMDYNYNMLMSLEPQGILITNGDNDTYPGWILTRIVKVRPDVSIVNRSLLNTDWYPLYVIEHGVPRFIGKGELDNLRDSLLKSSKEKPPNSSAGLYGDTLITRIIEASERTGRPVYLSQTLIMTEPLKPFQEKGRDLGLVVLVTPTQKTYGGQLRTVLKSWISSFRTGGLDSWELRYSPPGDAPRMMMANYAYALAHLIPSIDEFCLDLKPELLHWYDANAMPILKPEMADRLNQYWCQSKLVPELSEWCAQKGLAK